MSTSNSDRRQHSRFPISFEYRLTIAAGREHVGVTGNLSLSGAYLASAEPELAASDVNKRGVLTFDTASEVISVNCRVVYVGSTLDDNPFPSGAGIVFNDPSEEAITAIWNLSIDHLMKR
jgi:PilZ domain